MQPRIIGIVCKDAGAANQIAHYILNNPGNHIFALQEPALSIFTSILGSVENLKLQEIVKASSEVITGSGWTSDFELEGIQMAQKNGKKAVTHLDHWNNYLRRFTRHSELILPNEFWVSDEYSYNIASELFKGKDIVRKTDYYLQYQVKSVKNLKKAIVNPVDEKETNVLFLSEPLIAYSESGEVQRSDDGHTLELEFISLIKNAGIKYLETRIRPHPSEIRRKSTLQGLNISVSDTSTTPLSNDLAWADIVIGIDSYALFVSDNAGIPTVSVSCWIGREMTIPRGRVKSLQKDKLIEFLRAK